MSQTVTERRPRRWPLYLSLFLNVVLIAAIAFGAWQLSKWRDRLGPMSGWMPREVERVLPEASREKVKVVREKYRGTFQPLFAAGRDARDKLTAVLAAEPFDPAAARAAFAAVRQADAALAEATSEVMVEIASVLTPEERKLVRDAAHERKRKGGKRDRGEDMPPPDGDIPPPPPPTP